MAPPAPLPRRGRPRKFASASKPVTLTLPVDVIDMLSAGGGDMSRAIVRLAAREEHLRAYPPAELVTFGRHAVIAVTPSKTLERRTGVSLVPLPDGRALISFEQALSIPALELLIADALEDRSLPDVDREIFQSIATILKTARRDADISLLQRSIIVLRGRTRAKTSAAAAR